MTADNGTTTDNSTTTRVLRTTPSLALLYPRAVLTGFARRGQRLPDTEYVRRDLLVDQRHLARYAEVCGFAVAGRLPVTYPHLLAFPVQIKLMSARTFPFALAGLVHVANRVTQHRPLRVAEPLTLSVRADNLRPHRRGRQFDVLTECAVAGQVVWREVSTYLKRERVPGRAAPPAPDQAPAPGPDPTGHGTEEVVGTWRVAGDAGRRYAAVSGDRNPIHLHPVTARLFGFPRAIAHGMWTTARCLAALQDSLPDACTVDVRFARPVLLPATVTLSRWSGDNHREDHRDGPGDGRDNGRGESRGEHPDRGWGFALRQAGTATPHLLGRVSPVGPVGPG
ncbi:MaoC family dehydratase [Goodfellowiella coeruleoviolacea]|uniref:Acyl dehydratase n=1 Tax=Goodfellowiella coeruleoviolacea TaxID=334858 RepID=A0AAE3KGU7_9PSEU|nr:MaoC/PaaZ C-terminal domain-containing protein [Goodfellowiella coeruleoviolacea]MCP2166252.1 Acyl dehydratase [Goodfellowiella coeruleoviolacea]